ncbi:hypothetical protein [Actinophytocola oryzae]|nr:hypothetical protein [Actinophytocola oryzae]
MSSLLRRSMVAALATVVSGVGLVAVAAPAAAAPVEYGTLTFSGDPGDYISGGNSYEYDTLDGDALNVSSDARALVSISVDSTTGDWWYLDFAAPNGQQLTSGATYTATRYPFNGTGAGFDLSGNGRGCNTLTATFTVIEATFDASDEVESFHASFEQHCEGGPAAARGEVHIGPAPTPLELKPTIASQGTVSPVSGRARVNGEVSCTQPVTVALAGDLSQVVAGRIVRGPLSLSVSCTPGATVPWTTIVTPSGSRPFAAGRAEAALTATAYDLAYDREVSTSVADITVLIENSPPSAASF